MTHEPEAHPTSESSAIGRREPSKRRILGEDGAEWIVEEVPAPEYDRRAGTCLLFRTVGIARRVRRFPSDWRTLSDAQLYRLSLER